MTVGAVPNAERIEPREELIRGRWHLCHAGYDATPQNSWQAISRGVMGLARRRLPEPGSGEAGADPRGELRD
jgi:hypothetical protein